MTGPPGPAAHLLAAFDHAPVGMAIVTRHSHEVVCANQALGDLLGLAKEDLVGRSIEDFRERRTGIRTRRPPPAVTAEIPTFSGERACRRSDGTTVWVEVHSCALPDSFYPELNDQAATGDYGTDSEPLCLMHLVDISRRRAAEAARDRRQAWASALGEIRLAVLLGAQPARSLALVCRRARMLLGAGDAVVIIPGPDEATGVVKAADGHDAQPLVDAQLPLEGTLAAQVLRLGRVVVTGANGQPDSVIEDLLPVHGPGAVLALPLRTPDVVIGVLCLVRPSGQPFGRSDIDVARSFADQAAAALHIGELRADRERLRVLEDRERIARDLHDSVIQELFAAGMALDSVQPLITSDAAADRVAATIDQLDETIRKIRSTIFELETSSLQDTSVDLLRSVVEGKRDYLGFLPRLDIEGDLDEAPAAVVDHLLGIIGEGLSNVARHAGATAATVHVTMRPSGAMTATITDNGSGFDAAQAPRGNGLANMLRRAELLGGQLEINGRPGTGTRLVLRTPPRTGLHEPVAIRRLI